MSTVAAAPQFFDKKQNFPMLMPGQQAAQFDEVMVLEHGSSGGSDEEWASHRFTKGIGAFMAAALRRLWNPR